MKNKILLLFNIVLLLPINIYAYSDKVIVGGETIGIEVKANGIYVVGFYEVNGEYLGKNAGFKKGDIIKKVNNKDVYSINNLNNEIIDPKEYTFQIERDNKEETITMKLEEEDNIIKTGLYVKDTINGIGTLSYIDPETNIFGSLGHEIQESITKEKFKISDGNIYKAEVSSITKSKDNITGEKNASIDKTKQQGKIIINENSGIFGIYEKEHNNSNLMEIASKEEIKKKDAIIRTVVSKSEIKDYKINIIAIDESDKSKNILFEITDKELLNKTGGIVQGMSGSPIIQDNKIIGVVNYVIVDNETRGYGIFITTMLEEGDKINS